MSDIVPTFCGLTAEEIQDLKQRVENSERAATYEADIAEQALSAMKELQQRNVELEAQVEQLRTSNGKKFTAALNVIDTDYHITLCFADCVKASKVSTSPQTGDATVIDVVYWDHCDLTVALVRSDFCNERAEYWAENGYGYTLGYKPHFTLGKGDCTSIYKCMVGKTYQVGGEYCRVFDVGVKTTPAQCLAEQHPDDAAVDRFAMAMKTKLAAARAKGRSGWDDKASCSGEHLAKLLVEHLEKSNTGTFEDIANFAMMLHQRGENPQLLRIALVLRDAEIKAQAVEDAIRNGITVDLVHYTIEQYVNKIKSAEVEL